VRGLVPGGGGVTVTVVSADVDCRPQAFPAVTFT
jgi:hypothetical protein